MISRDCRVGGVLNLELCEDKLFDLIGLLGDAASLEAGWLRSLCEDRFTLIHSSEFNPRFKSGRELDRHLDEACEVAYSNYTEAKELNSNLNRAVEGMRTIVSALKRE